MEEVYAVIDLKSFYASCECAARGLDIFSTPLVVCDPDRSDSTIVMSATPYLKKIYGIPNVCRKRDLPEVKGMIYARPRMSYYIQISAKIVSLFLDFVDEEDLHVYSIDESFLRFTPYLHLYGGSPETMAKAILTRIKKELHLVATCGMGPNMFLAKTCLDNEGKKRPPYIAHWHQEDVQKKLWSISPITKIWGIADRTALHLYRLGIRSMESLAKTDPKVLKKEFGVMGLQLYQMAWGIDETDIREKYVPKERNISIGQTLMRDYQGEEALLILREMTDDLCLRLRLSGRKCGCVSLFVGYNASTGGGFSRQAGLNRFSDDNDDLFEAVAILFHRFYNGESIRGLGISFSKLAAYQYDQLFFEEDETRREKNENLHRIWDEINLTFGRSTCMRASSRLPESTALERHKQIGGHHE